MNKKIAGMLVVIAVVMTYCLCTFLPNILPENAGNFSNNKEINVEEPETAVGLVELFRNYNCRL